MMPPCWWWPVTRVKRGRVFIPLLISTRNDGGGGGREASDVSVSGVFCSPELHPTDCRSAAGPDLACSKIRSRLPLRDWLAGVDDSKSSLLLWIERFWWSLSESAPVAVERSTESVILVAMTPVPSSAAGDRCEDRVWGTTADPSLNELVRFGGSGARLWLAFCARNCAASVSVASVSNAMWRLVTGGVITAANRHRKLRTYSLQDTA